MLSGSDNPAINPKTSTLTTIAVNLYRNGYKINLCTGNLAKKEIQANK
jgi:hypothetical protein